MADKEEKELALPEVVDQASTNKAEEKKEIRPTLSKAQHTEAPASVTVKIKSPEGFIYMWTMRDDHSSTLMFKIKAMQKRWIEEGYTPVEERSFSGGMKKSAPPKDYLPDRTCPIDGARLYSATTKNGKHFIACENRKWDMTQKRAIGCSFIEWQDDYQNA